MIMMRLGWHSWKQQQKKEPMIRTTPGLGPAEVAFLEKRQLFVLEACERLIGAAVARDHVPRIALVGAGGGARSGIAFSAFLSTIESSGLLDVVTYVSAVSGSSWPLSCWLWTGTERMSTTLQAMWSRFDTDFFKNLSLRKLMPLALSRLAFGQSFNFVDVIGWVVTNKFEKGLFERCYGALTFGTLHSAADMIMTGRFPLPLFYASLVEAPCAIIEFTVFESGSMLLGGFVPTAHLGSFFDRGFLKKRVLPPTISLINAILGSAYSCSWNELAQSLNSADCTLFDCVSFLHKLAQFLGRLPLISRHRFSVKSMSNFMYGLAGPLKRSKKITFFDGALHHPIAVSPCLSPDRRVDIIVIFATAAAPVADDMRSIALSAHLAGRAIPALSVCNDEPILVFEDTSRVDVPTIIYVRAPLHLLRRYETTKIVYTESEVAEIWASGVAGAEAVRAPILAAIAQVIKKKAATPAFQ